MARSSIPGLVTFIAALSIDVHLVKILRGRARTLNKGFALRDFMQSFLILDNMPITLIRLERAGDSSDAPLSLEPG